MIALPNPPSPISPDPASPRPRRALPLQRKLPLLILGVLTFVLAISVVVSYYEIRRAAQLSAGDRLTSLSRVIATMVEQQTNARLTLMNRVARDTAIVVAFQTQTMSPSAEKALGALMTVRADTATPGELWAADGQRLGSEPVRLDTPNDTAHLQSGIRELVEAVDSARVGRLYISKGRLAFWIATPVWIQGKLLGFVAQQRRFAASTAALQPLHDLIGSDFEFYFRNAGESTWIDLAGRVIPPPTRSKAFHDGLRIVTHGAQAPSLASTTAIAGTPILITVEQPMAAILARPLAATRALVVIAVPLTLFGAMLTWVFGRRMARPLVELTAAAEAITHGTHPQLVHVANDSGGGDEIGRLAMAFNRMATQVAESSDAQQRAVERLTKSVETQEFLADASRILAGSLSDDSLLVDLTRSCVPRIADYCTIHVVEDDGAIRRVETAHYDRSKQPVVIELLAHYAHRLDGEGLVPDVVRSRRPVLVPSFDRAALRAAAPDARAAHLLDVIGPTAFMCVPLIARGRAFGAMSFTMTDSGRSFAADDLGLAVELAHRTASSIDNAVIYRRSISLRLEAEAASNAKSDFLAKMSHEIRTPINAMMGYAELLEMGISGPVTESQSKQLGRIRASGDHLTSLVDEILDLAKIEAGRMSLEPTVGTVGEAADAALALIRPQAATKGVELKAAIEGNPRIEYRGDPQRVHQIITNLLSNAVKFTPTGGSVSIVCGTGKRPDRSDKPHEGAANGEPSRDWSFIAVLDTGVGIGSEDRERIFQPFVQVDGGYTRTQGGTGLGLTISRNLAQMMGGDIVVDSVVGEGSRFALWLPMAN